MFIPIFGGSDFTWLKSEPAEGFVCPQCGQRNCMNFNARAKYVHCLLIPLFPNGRDLLARCSHCGYEWSYWQMPPEMKQEMYAYSKRHRRPILHYAGLILFVVFLCWFVHFSMELGRQEAENLSNPMVKDLYEVKIDEDGSYTYLRVEDIRGDSVYFSANDYSVTSSVDVKKIDKDENYDTEHLIAVSKSDLKARKLPEGISLYTVKREQKDRK